MSFNMSVYCLGHSFDGNERGGGKTRRKINRACVNCCACVEVIATSSGSVGRSGADLFFARKNFIYFLTLPSSWLFFVTSLLFFKFDSSVEERTTHHVAI